MQVTLDICTNVPRKWIQQLMLFLTLFYILNDLQLIAFLFRVYTASQLFWELSFSISLTCCFCAQTWPTKDDFDCDSSVTCI